MSAEEDQGIPESDILHSAWDAEIRPVLSESELELPEGDKSPVLSREVHTSLSLRAGRGDAGGRSCRRQGSMVIEKNMDRHISSYANIQLAEDKG